MKNKNYIAFSCNFKDKLLYQKAAFSLVEMLMALLVASLLLTALAPVMTRRMNENVVVQGNMSAAGTKQHVLEIEYGSEDCPEIKTDADGSTYCEGEFEVPSGYNGYFNVTAIGAGGGGGAAPTAGYTEYTTAGNHSFPVPVGINQIEATIVEGGAGGAAGYIEPDIQGYAWTHSGTLNRSYVSTSIVSSNIKNVKVSGDTISAAYKHATAVLAADSIKNAAGSKLFITLAGGGGGGGRGYRGTGGGGAAARVREAVTISKGNNYDVKVGLGGQGHSCNSAGGCGGSASSFGGLIMAGGGGGGGWPINPDRCNATDGENGGSGSVATSSGTCSVLDDNGKHIVLVTCSGGRGANPGGSTALNDNQSCTGTTTINSHPGGNGANSMFGTGGIYDTNNSALRDGKGYGSGGCGGGGVPSAFGNGAPGFVAAEWLNLGNGGAGGGGGSMVPFKKVAVTPTETLSVIVGKGGNGGAAGNITNSITTYKQGLNGEHSYQSYLKRGDTTLISTSGNSSSTNICSCGGCGGLTSGILAAAGWVGGCWAPGYKVENGVMINTNYPGFSTGHGRTAGNTTSTTANTFTVNDKGGDGGTTEIFGKKTCEAGKGSTVFGTAGGNATGYGGCGGGGGYGLANGGSGAPGFARISWNKYWDTATAAYKLTQESAGGGGASGNVLKQSIQVKSNQTIKFRIGKGGSGAYVSNNTLINAAKGGDTVFGDVKAGGGGGGRSVEVNNSNQLINGQGGIVSNICHFGSSSYLNNKKCIKGTAGQNANAIIPGKGADFAGYTLTLITKNGEEKIETKKEIKGTGGSGGTVDTGDNANGKNAEGYASGGGGAALRDVGQVSSSSTGNIANNPNRGGAGSNGKIILEWYE